jgi:hypothetical protein
MRTADPHGRSAALRGADTLARRTYEDALRKAGVTRRDLALLRELADANAADLRRESLDRLTPPRIFL